MVELPNQRTLQHFLLHKQHLAADTTSKKKKVVNIVKDICALHAQVPTSPYISLWNRMNNFQIKDLEDSLYQQRSLVKIWCMRGTLHIIPTENLSEYYQSTKKIGAKKHFHFNQYHQKIVDVLSKNESLTVKEIRSQIIQQKKNEPGQNLIKDNPGIIREMCHKALLVPTKPKGQWKSNLHTYNLLKQWLPTVKLDMVDELEAKKKIIMRYISVFGPVQLEDISWWLGSPKREVQDILPLIRDKIEVVRLSQMKGIFFIDRSDLDCLREFSNDRPSIHLLPRFDPYIMGYKNRERLIPKHHEKKVYWSTRAEVSASILVNGRIIGTWSSKDDKDKHRFTLSFFDKVDKKLIDTILANAEKLVGFISEKHPVISINKS